MKLRGIFLFFLLVCITLSFIEVNADPLLPLPRIPFCGDQDDPADPIVYHCSDLVPFTDVQIYKVPDEDNPTLVFDFIFREASYNNELGLFIVDDSKGTINGISPSEPGYIDAAFSNPTIIFPSGSNAYTPDVTIEFETGDYLSFFIIQNNSLANFLANNPDNDVAKSPRAFFSLDILNPDSVDHFVGFQSISGINTQFGFEDMTNGGDNDFDDIVYNIIPPLEPACNNWVGEYFDNPDLSGTPVFTRCDNNIDFNWTRESSPNTDVIPLDNFSVRWKRTIDVVDAGTYRFRTLTDDGFRLYIDGVLQINDWTSHSFEERSKIIPLKEGLHTIQMDYFEQTEDALAYFNYYYCPNGEQDCGLNIAPQYQTKYLDYPMPSTCETEANQTISSYGCAITSVAMALQNYGINTTPENLNTWLSDEDNDGYTGGECTANLDWTKILLFAEDEEAVGNPVSLKWETTTNANETIQDGNPVILQISNNGTHFVLGIDSININGNNAIGINDPHHAFSCLSVANDPPLPPSSVLSCIAGDLRHATTTIEESSYRGTATPLKYLEINDSPRTPSLQLSITGTNVYMINSYGRIGFDITTNTFVNSFPNGMYYDSEIVPPGYDPSGTISRTLFLPENAEGIYLMRLVPTSDQEQRSSEEIEYNINFRGYDGDFNLIETDFSGTKEAGETIEFFISFLPGQSIELIPPEQIFIPIISH